MIWRSVVVAVAVTAVATTLAALHQRAVAEDRVEKGRRLFMEQGCYGCHTVDKVGTPIGPDLSHLGARYSATVLEAWLRDPALQRPTAHMPRLDLTEPQVKALAAFLSSLS
jgi:cytochrome c oxidase subunit 2